MEWTKQTEEAFKGWTELQGKLWGEWRSAMQGMAQPQSTGTWRKAVDAWEDSIKKSLDAQIEWTRLWAESFTHSGSATPKDVIDKIRQGQDLIQQGTEAQKRLWEEWFAVVKKLDPPGLGGNWAEAQKLVQGWQEAAQKAKEAQAEWARAWSGIAAAGGEKSRAQR